MTSSETIKDAWSAEYKRKGIPSSFRKDPTRTVVEFISWLKKETAISQGKTADIGAGQGRNSFYLASQGFEVTSLELIEENVSVINAQAEKEKCPVKAYAQDAASDWPMKNHSLDIAIDVFCYKHIVDKEKQKNYRQELWRTLKPTGFYFISLASERDGFYGPLLQTSPDPKKKLIVDPYSNIPSFLYAEEDLQREFGDFFELVHLHEQRSTSPMYGKEYPRVVLNAVFKKLQK